ncbi:MULTISPECIES: DUF5615 family PIN-like protein [Kamptonema]|uniref:DUF5615 family PIN-like protein n=1 Tax=Kamptonema TaxID=1501433 RepID=UPI0001DAC3DD|nr:MULTISPECIES: DUF5615 family PIN-like protein [Kamptonema]CBN55406.1 conserved hypothetical protein [Kamptonema sp. PCC 6506]
MARLYTDENFPLQVVAFLRVLGHDVLTVQEAGKANQGIPDEEVLAFAVSIERTVLTGNRRDYMKLHRSHPNHTGIIVCTEELNFQRLATRINEAISAEEILTGKLIRVNRPPQ